MDVLYGMSLLHNIEDLLYKGIKHIAFGKWRNKVWLYVYIYLYIIIHIYLIVL